MRSSPSVGSSNTQIGASCKNIRAKLNRRAWPPERPLPPSPIQVSRPWGSDSTQSRSCAFSRADFNTDSSASGRAIKRFFRKVAWNKWVCWETTPMVFRKSDSEKVLRSWLPIWILPLIGSQNRTSRLKRVDFPVPVSPKMATRWPCSICKSNPSRTHGSESP